MNAADPREQGLLRLFVKLKAAFWAAALVTLAIGIWNVAMGHDRGPPMLLIGALPLLALLQLGVWIAWRRARRARQKRGAA